MQRNYSRPYYRAGFTGWFRGLFTTVIVSHPGTVTATFAVANVVGKVAFASVSGDTTTASVRGKATYGSVTGDTETATVSSQAKFLVKDYQ